MTDLFRVVPHLDVSQYSHILPSLERAAITSSDLLTLDALDLAKRAQVPLTEVRRLSGDVLKALHADLEDQCHATADISIKQDSNEADRNDNAAVTDATAVPLKISTLDPTLDDILGGGFPAGRVIEVTGERYGMLSDLVVIKC